MNISSRKPTSSAPSSQGSKIRNRVSGSKPGGGGASSLGNQIRGRVAGAKPGASSSNSKPGALKTGLKAGGLSSGLKPGAPSSGLKPGASSSVPKPGGLSSGMKPGAPISASKPGDSSSSLGDQIRGKVEGATSGISSLGDKIRDTVTAGTNGPRDTVSLQDSLREGPGAESEPAWMKNLVDNFSPQQSMSKPEKPAGSSPLQGSTPGESGAPSGSLGSLGGQLDRWDDTILREAERWGVPPERIKAMMALESGGDPGAHQVNPTHGDTHGLMQINAAIWGDEARKLGYDLSTPEGQIGMGSYILRQGYEIRGDWDQASSWYFNPSGGGDSVNGTSNQQYMDKVNQFIAQMGGG